MSNEQADKSNTPRTDIIAGLWGGGDATIRRQLRRMEDHARQLENELSLAERRLATSEKCRNNLAASIPSSIEPTTFDLKDTLHKVVNNLLEHGGEHYKRMFGRSGSCIFTNAEVGAIREVVFRALKAKLSASGSSWKEVPREDYGAIMKDTQTLDEKAKAVYLWRDNGQMLRLELPPLSDAQFDTGESRAT